MGPEMQGEVRIPGDVQRCELLGEQATGKPQVADGEGHGRLISSPTHIYTHALDRTNKATYF